MLLNEVYANMSYPGHGLRERYLRLPICVRLYSQCSYVPSLASDDLPRGLLFMRSVRRAYDRRDFTLNGAARTPIYES